MEKMTSKRPLRLAEVTQVMKTTIQFSKNGQRLRLHRALLKPEFVVGEVINRADHSGLNIILL